MFYAGEAGCRHLWGRKEGFAYTGEEKQREQCSSEDQYLRGIKRTVKGRSELGRICIMADHHRGSIVARGSGNAVWQYFFLIYYLGGCLPVTLETGSWTRVPK